MMTRTFLIVLFSVFALSGAGRADPVEFRVGYLADTMDTGTAKLMRAIGTHLDTTAVVLTPVPLSHDELLAQFKEGRIQLAMLNAANYVAVRSDARFGPAILAARVERNGHPEYSYCIVSSGASRLRDLADRQFLYPSRNSASGYLFPKAWLTALHPTQVGLEDNGQPEGEQMTAWFNRIEMQHAGEHEDVLVRVLRDPETFCACYAGKLSASEYKAIHAQAGTTSDLNILYRSDPVIPNDALVIHPDVTEAHQQALRRAIAVTIADVASGATRFGAISSIGHAEDADFDEVRAKVARSAGKLYRIGLSLRLDPRTEHEKLQAWRPIQEAAFRKGAFLELHVFSADETGQLLAALQANDLDIGELPPLAAGRAMRGFTSRSTMVTYDVRTVPLKPMMLPQFAIKGANGEFVKDLYYDSVYIVKRDPDVPEATEYVRDLGPKLRRIIGQRSELDYPSASGWGYPKWRMFKDRLLKRDAEPIEWESSARDVVYRVATDPNVDVGFVAKFMLERLRGESDRSGVNEGVDPQLLRLPEADDVIVVDAGTVSIPNGAYVASAELSKRDRAEDRIGIASLLEACLELSDSDATTPSFVVINKPAHRDAVAKMKDAHEFLFPEDNTVVRAVLTVGMLTVLASVIFLIAFSRRDAKQRTLEPREAHQPQRTLF